MLFTTTRMGARPAIVATLISALTLLCHATSSPPPTGDTELDDTLSGGGENLREVAKPAVVAATPDNNNARAFRDSTKTTGPVVRPYFDDVSPRNVTAVVGQSTILHCRVKHVGDRTYMNLRYCRNVKLLASAVSTFIGTWGFMITAYSTAIFFTQLINVPVMTNAIAILSSCYILSALSGFSGVVWTDTVQTVAIFLTLITLIIYGLIQVGNVWDIIPLAQEGGRFTVEWSLDPTIRLTFWSSLLGYGPQYLAVMTLVSPGMYQRYCALADSKSINKVAIIQVLGIIFSRLSVYFLGYIMYALYAQCDPLLSGKVKKYDQVLPYFLQDLSNGKSFIQGVFITGYTCSAFSTLTTSINTMSITIYEDFLEARVNPTRTFIKAKRYIYLIGLLVTLACYLALYFLQHVKVSIIELTTYCVFLLALYMAIIMTGIFSPRINSKCVFWGAGIGSIYAIINEIGRHSSERSSSIKMMRTDGCPNNVTLESPLLEPNSSQTFYLFKISPFYQFSIYYALTTSVMLIASYFVGRKDYTRLDEKLISPLIRPYLPKTGEVSIPLSPHAEDSVQTEMERNTSEVSISTLVACKKK